MGWTFRNQGQPGARPLASSVAGPPLNHMGDRHVRIKSEQRKQANSVSRCVAVHHGVSVGRPSVRREADFPATASQPIRNSCSSAVRILSGYRADRLLLSLQYGVR